MHKLEEVFCDVDDFSVVLIPEWEKTLLTDGTRKRQRSGRMTMSEVMTIIIFFQTRRDFKNFYTGYLSRFYKSAFPTLLSYTRFLEVRPTALVGWFYGFKLHLIVNHQGGIVAAKITPANVHDTKPVADMAFNPMDKLYADKGYISKALSSDLLEKGITLVTNVRKNMKAKAISLWDRAMLSRRFIIETILLRPKTTKKKVCIARLELAYR